jgi:metal-sulfur cluster biosynthetic enzyme
MIESARKGTGADRRAEVLGALDAIRDPCSVALGRPIGLVGMGIIDDVIIDGDCAVVSVLPTYPDCLFRGVFEAEIEARVGALPWCGAVRVKFCAADVTWDESRMTPDARLSLQRRRAAEAGRRTSREGNRRGVVAGAMQSLRSD